jgi:acetyl esterase
MLSTNLRARAIQRLAGHLMTRPIPALRMHDVPRHTHTLHVKTRRGTVRCTVYSPPETVAGRPPVYVNLHGGGFVIRHPGADDHICRYLAAAVGCFVVNVDYDVAPQRPFPAASTQAYDVVRWVADSAAEQGWDGSRLAVGGQSAGGNLAAGVAIAARDAGTPALALQVLLYPPLDLTVDPGQKRARTDKPLLTPGLGRIFDAAYVPDPAKRADPLVSPLRAADLAGVAPAVVVTAELDLLRDEGDAYAAALTAAGVPVSHHVVAGVDHAFTHRGPTEAANDTFAVVSDALRAAFADAETTTPSPGAGQ